MTWGHIGAFALGMIAQSVIVVLEERWREWRGQKRKARR